MRIGALAVSLLVGVSLVAAPAPALAAPDPLGETLSTPLLADCSSVTATGREYARLHAVALCGADTTPPDEPLRTESVGGEECGTVTLSLESRGGGLAALTWRVESRTGPIVDIELDVASSGRAGGAMHRFIDHSARLRARDTLIAYVGSGRALATVSGTIQTFTATCRIAPASVRIHAR